MVGGAAAWLAPAAPAWPPPPQRDEAGQGSFAFECLPQPSGEGGLHGGASGGHASVRHGAAAREAARVDALTRSFLQGGWGLPRGTAIDGLGGGNAAGGKQEEGSAGQGGAAAAVLEEGDEGAWPGDSSQVEASLRSGGEGEGLGGGEAEDEQPWQASRHAQGGDGGVQPWRTGSEAGPGEDGLWGQKRPAPLAKASQAIVHEEELGMTTPAGGLGLWPQLQAMQQQLEEMYGRLEQTEQARLQAERSAAEAEAMHAQRAAALDALQARTTVLEGRVRFLECELEVCVRRGEYDPSVRRGEHDASVQQGEHNPSVRSLPHQQPQPEGVSSSSGHTRSAPEGGRILSYDDGHCASDIVQQQQQQQQNGLLHPGSKEPQAALAPPWQRGALEQPPPAPSANDQPHLLRLASTWDMPPPPPTAVYAAALKDPPAGAAHLTSGDKQRALEGAGATAAGLHHAPPLQPSPASPLQRRNGHGSSSTAARQLWYGASDAPAVAAAAQGSVGAAASSWSQVHLGEGHTKQEGKLGTGALASFTPSLLAPMPSFNFQPSLSQQDAGPHLPAAGQGHAEPLGRSGASSTGEAGLAVTARGGGSEATPACAPMACAHVASADVGLLPTPLQHQQGQGSSSTRAEHVPPSSAPAAAVAAASTNAGTARSSYSNTSDLISSLYSRYSEAQSFLSELRGSKHAAS